MTKPKDSADSTKKVPARAIAQKAYKKIKKKRAKIKRAQNDTPKSSSPEENKNKRVSKMLKWHRGTPWNGGPPKSTNRPVDDDKINAMLEKRSKAKAEKNYTVSDSISQTLRDELEIVYNDEKRQWHTRDLLTDAQKEARKAKAMKR
mmetsp:Transcript_18734/g.28460  ORF Transcript_18734/g.28460 Transcript_18734/m.28460 type:complete len:147 (+) Transcript_18734:177-617(+)